MPDTGTMRTVGRQWKSLLLDCAAWAVALYTVGWISLDFGIAANEWYPITLLVLVAILGQCIFGALCALYVNRFLPGSFNELKALLGAVLLTGVILGVAAFPVAAISSVPRSVAFISIPLAVTIIGGARLVQRIRHDARERPTGATQRTLIYGAGYLGNYLVQRMLSDRLSPYFPVGFIDDDPAKRKLRVDGIDVLGTGADLSAIALRTGATSLVISIARADATLLRQVSDAGKAAGLRVLVFPVLEEVLEGKSRLRDVREIEIEDLIGRHPIDTHIESMAGYLTGKRVLVTGAGGSIGSELCRQINRFHPEELIMLDRDETGLQGVQLLIDGNGLLTNKNIVLADIRDPEALNEIFESRRPEVVFHAAALKHLPMLERYPREAWKTNVVGTLNVLEAARAVGVRTFVNISTDKAANPTSVLGYSKRIAEQLTSWAAQQSGMTYLSVRFGNVLGSRGSLVPLFKSMIAAGGPITVTDPNATRFFMTIPEACNLVVQAGGIGSPGEVLILDMGDPVRILDIAERMIAKSGSDIAIVFTGLRPGEKLNEELMGAGEADVRPIHPKISHTYVTPISPQSLDQKAWENEMAHSVALSEVRHD
ncbi:polysaccharide biosynthesis protein [Cryobacterium algoricola]|uniref:Polysaccharide biosynthesis protein n=1 Tax=Cryobacterium algoricola TaxID=1259183 RepID=A0ABY2I7V9_9MICO|nr:nucleoside-diphosphate sugar epimerase/dehydratase [Cryobacterium algoricola]TFB82587.1 polysaccharide biosynthesis protein [Cryobacterium algoricola]